MSTLFCRSAIGFVAVVTIMMSGRVSGQDASTPEDVILGAVIANNRGEFFKALASAAKKDIYIKRMIQVLRASGSSEFQKCAAAFILGKEKSVLAVQALTENILLKNTEDWNGQQDLEPVISEYPACTALSEIGYPAAKAVAAKLMKTNDKVVEDKCILVLSVIFERDRGMVKSYLLKNLKNHQAAEKGNDFDEILKQYTEPYEAAPKPGNTDSGGKY